MKGQVRIIVGPEGDKEAWLFVGRFSPSTPDAEVRWSVHKALAEQRAAVRRLHVELHAAKRQGGAEACKAR